MSGVVFICVVVRGLAALLAFYCLGQATNLVRYLSEGSPVDEIYLLWVLLACLFSIMLWRFSGEFSSVLWRKELVDRNASSESLSGFEFVVLGLGLYFWACSVFGLVRFAGDFLVMGLMYNMWGRNFFLNMLVSMCGIFIGGGMVVFCRRIVRMLRC